ncbi:hypothetical protein LCGC14_1867420 [marine sediment metagenome]|uniref:Uncharacterized protein n=1 Tax=marine sediment metagenome TaxID=412755 RepID=A0A0F9G5W3_9ZZZZ
MSESKKPTVSEIRARDEDMQGEESLAKFIFHARTDIPYLLDLVERMGKELGNQQCPGCEKYFSDPCLRGSYQRPEPCIGCKEARALLEELKQ